MLKLFNYKEIGKYLAGVSIIDSIFYSIQFPKCDNSPNTRVTPRIAKTSNGSGRSCQPKTSNLKPNSYFSLPAHTESHIVALSRIPLQSIKCQHVKITFLLLILASVLQTCLNILPKTKWIECFQEQSKRVKGSLLADY